MTVAFALSGGGNLGPMQAGAVVALLEAGITPDLLVGTSVGALNAAFLSSRPGLSGAQSLVDAWATLRRQEVASFSPIDLLAGFFGVRDHLLAASRLRALIRKWVEIEASGGRQDHRRYRRDRCPERRSGRSSAWRRTRSDHRQRCHSGTSPLGPDGRPLADRRQPLGRLPRSAGPGSWRPTTST